MRTRMYKELDRAVLGSVVGGGADLGGIMQAASPLLGMIPGFGPIAQMIMPMIGQMAGGQSQSSSAAAAPQASDPSAAAQPSQASSPRQHGTSVSVAVG